MDKSLWQYFGGNKKTGGTWGAVPHFQLDASFCLRGACAGLARKMQLDFSDEGPAELTCSAKTSAKPHIYYACTRNVSKEATVQTLMIKSIYIQYMR